MSKSISVHARLRIRERAGGSRKSAKDLFDFLWEQGRDADSLDFLQFKTNKLEGRRYRVAERNGKQYMVVRDAVTGVYITLIKR